MGTILVIVGRSGHGKSEIAQGVLRSIPNARMVVSHTTRMPRVQDTLPGEYCYHTSGRSVFDNKEAFLWVEEHSGNLYGTMKESVTEVLDSVDAVGIMILVPTAVPKLHAFVIDHQGDDLSLVLIFIKPLPMNVVRQRLENTPERYQQVVMRYPDEKKWPSVMKSSGLFFHVISNDGPLESTIAGVLEFLNV